MGGNDQIVTVNDEVVDRSCRQIKLQRLPVRAVIKGNPRARLGAGIEQALALRIFPHGMNVGAVGESASDWRPGLAEVSGFKNVGLEIIEPVGVDGGVGGPRCEPRWFDQADHGPFGKTFGSHVGPSFSIVTRKLDQAIVGAHPDHTSLLR